MKIEKVYPAGWKMETNDETIYFGEYGQFGCYHNDGVVYKDKEAFETGKGVCYINEYGFDNDDVANANNEFAFATELEGNSYVALSGYTRADLEELCEGTSYDVVDFFNHLDWMSPETLMCEWLDDEKKK